MEETKHIISITSQDSTYTRTACERLFCSLSDSRIGVSCRRSRLQVAVGCTPKWTATCSPLGRQDSCRLPSQLRMEFEEEAQVPFGSGRPAAVEHTQLKRRVLATATLCFRPVLVRPCELT